MPIDDIENAFENYDDTTTQQLIKQLLDPKDVVMHTEIPNPTILTVIRCWEKHLAFTRHWYESAEAVRLWADDFELHMVSYDRKREASIEKMISAVNAAQHIGEVTENRWFGKQEGKV